MKETQILRGLGKAKAAVMPAYADGMAPRPTMTDRMIGSLTAGMFGYKAPPRPAAVAPVAAPAPVEQPTGLRKTANILRDRPSQIDNALRDAGAYADGVVPYMDDNSVIHGPGTSTSDSVTARVSKDEAILPAETVKAVGANNIARLIEHTNGVAPKRGLGVAPEYADGFVSGVVDKAKKGLSVASDFLKGGAATAPGATPVAPPAATPTPTYTSSAPLQPVSAVGQDAASAAGRVGANAASTAEAGEAAALSKTATRGLGKAALPLAATLSAAGSYNTPTKTYQDRTGIENGLGARAAGVMQDLGNNLTFGLAGKLGDYIAGNEPSTAPAVGTPVPAPTPAQSGTIDQAAPVAAPTQPVAAPTLTRTSAPEARRLLSDARNGGGEAIQPGTGYVVTGDGSGSLVDPETGEVITNPATSTPTATRIDSRGLNGARATPAGGNSGPFDESKALLREAASADASGTLSGQIRSANLRKQATAAADIANNEAGHSDRLAAVAATNAGNAIKSNLDVAANAREEVTADQQRADAFQKRLERFYPDTGTGKDKVDNSAKRSELQTMLEATMAKLPKEEQAKLINPYTGQARGVEALDPKLAERLLFNAKVRDRVQEAGNGLGNRLAGNQAGPVSDNLLDYDLGTATKRGGFYVFPNGAKISENDFRYLEGQANTFLPNAIQDIYNTPTSNFSSRARNGR